MYIHCVSKKAVNPLFNCQILRSSGSGVAHLPEFLLRWRDGCTWTEISVAENSHHYSSASGAVHSV